MLDPEHCLSLLPSSVSLSTVFCSLVSRVSVLSFLEFLSYGYLVLSTSYYGGGRGGSGLLDATRGEGGPMSAITNEIRLQAHHPFGPQVLEVRNCRRTLLPDLSVLLGAALS